MTVGLGNYVVYTDISLKYVNVIGLSAPTQLGDIWDLECQGELPWWWPLEVGHTHVVAVVWLHVGVESFWSTSCSQWWIYGLCRQNLGDGCYSGTGGGCVSFRLPGRPTKLRAHADECIGENTICWKDDGCVGHCGPEIRRAVCHRCRSLWPTASNDRGPAEWDSSDTGDPWWVCGPTRPLRKIGPPSFGKGWISLWWRMPHAEPRLLEGSWRWNVAFVSPVQLTCESGAERWSYGGKDSLSGVCPWMDDSLCSKQRWNISCHCYRTLPWGLWTNPWFVVSGIFLWFHYHLLPVWISLHEFMLYTSAFPLFWTCRFKGGIFGSNIATCAIWKGRELCNGVVNFVCYHS